MRRTSASAVMPTGTLIRKMLRQPAPAGFSAMSAPPISWPPTPAMPMVIP
jgi:hypothetical protein